MGIFVGGLLAAALMTGAHAQVMAIPEPHILVIDRSMLKSNDPALANRFEASARGVEIQIMARHRANLILDKSAVVVGLGNVDVTAEAIAALILAEPRWVPAQIIAPAQSVSSPVASARPPGGDADWVHASGNATSDDEKAATPPLGNEPDTPMARIAIIDRQALLRSSAVGKNIAAQVHELTKSAEDELHPESLSPKKDGELLQAQTANLAPNEKDVQIADFQQRSDAFSRKVRQRQDQIRAAVAAAQKRVEDVAGPIVQQMVRDSGVDLIVDRSAVVVCDDALDMTMPAIEKLDAALQSVNLSLSADETK